MISPRTIIRVVGEHYGLTREQLLSKSRKPTLAQPRQVAMLLVRIITGMSYPAIGREFQRDHSSVMHGCGIIEEELTECLILQGAVEAIRERLDAMADEPTCPHCGEMLQNALPMKRRAA
jgi:chromosomal replication initiator protein